MSSHEAGLAAMSCSHAQLAASGGLWGGRPAPLSRACPSFPVLEQALFGIVSSLLAALYIYSAWSQHQHPWELVGSWRYGVY